MCCGMAASPVQPLVYGLRARAPAVSPGVTVWVLRTHTHSTCTCQYWSLILSSSDGQPDGLLSRSVVTHLGWCPEHPDVLGRDPGAGGAGHHLAHHPVRGRGVRHGVPGIGDHDPGARHRPRHRQRGQELPLKYLYFILWQIKIGQTGIRILKSSWTYLSSFFCST